MFMGNNKDVIKILIMVTIGMFIPFIGSIVLAFGINLLTLQGWVWIFSAFLYFLVFFGIELGVVYIYYNLTNRAAQRAFDKTSPVNKNEK
jgi:polyferredoxin